jgi:hypothetical protein
MKQTIVTTDAVTMNLTSHAASGNDHASLHLYPGALVSPATYHKWDEHGDQFVTVTFSTGMHKDIPLGTDVTMFFTVEQARAVVAALAAVLPTTAE